MRRRISSLNLRPVLALSLGALVLSTVVTSPVATATPARASATPVAGGVLNVLGSGDVDYLDPNITYYSLGYSVAREFSRQLYSFPAINGKTTNTVPDLATGMPRISNHGKTYRITIRSGAKWNTSPAWQVTAADVVRGVKTTCNPYQPFGGLPDYETLIVGFKKFCNGFARVNPFSTSAMRNYINKHHINGVHPATGNPLTVVFTLTYAAGYFTDMLALPAFSPRPVEMLNYKPASSQEAHHTVSDGPYKVSSYSAFDHITFVRNSAWDASTDPVRKAYADKINIDETSDPYTGYQQMKQGSAKADTFFGSIDYQDARSAHAAHDPRLVIRSEIASNPYLVFNTKSPNNGKAMQRVGVRRAISYALKHTALVNNLGGTLFNTPLTHVLPAQIRGSKAFNDYPHKLNKARQLLAASGHRHPTLKFVYRPSSPTSTRIFHTVKSQLAHAGITVKGVPVSDAAFYTVYLQNPSAARQGKWDISIAGWGPDWYGQAALSFFEPLFDGRIEPPASSNFGLFNDSKLNHLIDRAQRAHGSKADSLWHQADLRVMNQAAFYPLSDPKEPTYHAIQVHGFVYMPAYQTGDFSNMWLDPANNGG